MTLDAETIVALGSAPPPAARVVLRLSGAGSFHAVAEVFRREGTVEAGVCRGYVVLEGAERHQRVAGVAHVGGLAGSTVGEAWRVEIPATVWGFVGPRSYTGEDVAELHLPGSPWVVEEVMRRLLAVPGVRMATAGEFTARAYLAGKMDLTAAEGVALAVSATDARQLRAARQLLAGTLAGSVRELVDKLATLLALLEAGIDFSEEDVSFIAADALLAGIDGLMESIRSLLARGGRFSARKSDAVVVLAGWPNAGKSTLMNALLGRERVVVSPVAGTTRDAVFDELVLRRGRVLVGDVAGSETVSVGGGVQGEIERDMQRAARDATATCDVLVLVEDGSRPEPPALTRPPDLVVRTKGDLGTDDGQADDARRPEMIVVSALTGVGMALLRERLDEAVFGAEGGLGLALNSRHVQQLNLALDGLAEARSAVGSGDEWVAGGLRSALDALGEITGVMSPDDVLGRVFATFCIGK